MSDTTEPRHVTALLGQVERIMSRQAEATEKIRSHWIAGDIAELPCHRSCTGAIDVAVGGARLSGFCPAHMDRDVCPLVGLKEKEMLARMKRAGFGSRYLDVDPTKIRGRETVEQYLSDLDQNLKDGRGLILSGDIGVGKTMTTAYIARRALEVGHGVWKVTHEQMVSMLMERDRKGALKRLIGVELLVIDDWGSANMADWVLGIVEGVVESRYANRQSTIVTTNLTVPQLKDVEAFRRIVDRWRQVNTLVAVGGTSQR